LQASWNSGFPTVFIFLRILKKVEIFIFPSFFPSFYPARMFFSIKIASATAPTLWDVPAIFSLQ